jgi:hypothetical protein
VYNNYYLSFYSLFSCVFSVSGYVVSNKRMIVNNELERMWKEAVMASFKVLSKHLPGGPEEKHEHLSQDSPSLGQELNLGPPKYKGGGISTQP